MSITKAPKIVQFAVGHEGLHSLLLGEDGVVYFVGTARRGEDGDQTKARRPPKPVKPKVFSRLEGQNVSYVRNPIDTVHCSGGKNKSYRPHFLYQRR